MKINLKPIEEQVVVVVGANSGIGRITAMQFAERGAKVVVSGRDQTSIQALADEIVRNGGDASAQAADVRDFEQVQRLADFAADTYGRIDTWMQTAAVTIYATFSETKPEEFRQIIETNLLGQIYGAKAALPHLRRTGRGALIHISSVEARRSLPYQSAYAASKHGIPAFLDALRMELEHEGTPISVTNVMPASINTPMFDKARTRLGVKPQPVPPVYPPEEAARAILYAAEHPVREIFVGGAGKGLGLLERISPRLGDLFLEKYAFQGQRSDEPKPAYAPSNLFEHLNGYDRVHGSYEHLTVPASKYTRLVTSPATRFGLAALALGAGAFISARAMKSEKIWTSLAERVR